MAFSGCEEEESRHWENKLTILKADAIDLKASIRAALHQWVGLCHPLIIGEVVDVKGRSFKGRQMVVASRKVSNHLGLWEWEATGLVLNNDGTPGKRVGEWSQLVFTIS